MEKVKDIAMQIRGVSYHPEDLHDNLDEDSVVLLRANNIKDGKLILDDVVYVSKSKVAEQQYLQTGDILICASSGSKELVGKAAFVDSVKSPMTFGAFCKVVRPQPEYSEYLGHYFDSPLYRRKISALSAGANINNIKNEHIDNLDIQLVDEKERRKIITILNELNMLISLRKQQLTKLDELVKARFVEMFGDLVVGDKIQTSKKKIGEIASVTKLAGFEFTKYIQYKEHGDIIMLRGLNCKQGKLILDDVKWIDRETSDLLPRSKLYYGDILMTYAGTIGDVAMVDENDKYHLAPNVAKVSINNKKAYNPIFLMYLFLYSNDYIMRFASQVAQASINMEKIRNFEYYFPDVTFQNQFAAFVERVDQQKQTVQQSLEKLELMKKALMQEYFG